MHRQLLRLSKTFLRHLSLQLNLPKQPTSRQSQHTKAEKIKKQSDSCSREEEILSIKSAEKDYETDIVDKQTELNDIKWSKQTNEKTFDMYKNLAADMEKLFSQGLVRESEYLNAEANKELYGFKILINDIDLIIYNNSTKLLFCRDAELQD